MLGPVTWLAILMFAVPLGLVLFDLWRRSLTRRGPDWETAAERLGLSRRGDGEELRFEGLKRGREVALALRPAGPGNPVALGVLDVAVDDGGLGLRLRRQGLLDRYGRDADHEIGDEAFDRRFVVQVARPDRLEPWLDEQRRRVLLAAATQFTRLESGRLVAEVSRGPGGDELEPRLTALIDLAEELEAGAGSQLQAGHPTASVPRAVASPEAVSAREPVHRDAAVDPPGAEAPPAPADHEQGDHEHADPGSSDPEPEGVACEDSAPGELAAATVSLALFGDAAASYEVTERFETRYRDRPVVWTGVLVDRTSSTAELELLALDPASLSPRVVRARFEVPPEAAAELEGRKGTPVEVQGRLAGCDAFLRALTLAGVTRIR